MNVPAGTVILGVEREERVGTAIVIETETVPAEIGRIVTVGIEGHLHHVIVARTVTAETAPPTVTPNTGVHDGMAVGNVIGIAGVIGVTANTSPGKSGVVAATETLVSPRPVWKRRLSHWCQSTTQHVM